MISSSAREATSQPRDPSTTSTSLLRSTTPAMRSAEVVVLVLIEVVVEELDAVLVLLAVDVLLLVLVDVAELALVVVVVDVADVTLVDVLVLGTCTPQTTDRANTISAHNARDVRASGRQGIR